MKRSKLAAGALCLLVAACSDMTTTGERGIGESHETPPLSRLGVQGFNPLLVRVPNPHFPNVFVTDDGYVIVDQEPVRIRREERQVTVSWALDSTSPWTFPEKDAIVFNAPLPQNLQCKIVGDRRKVVNCSYVRTERRKYPYTITVTDGSRTLKSDPSMMND